MKCWITTHWPSPPGFEVDRHVYLKAWRKRCPEPGDLVLIYEAETATVDGKRVKDAIRCHRGKREMVRLPLGRGRIIGAVTVSGSKRGIASDDLVYEYGNLKEWSILPCGGMKPVRDVPRADVMESVGKPGDTNPRFWSLWQVPDQRVGKLLHTLGL